MNINSKKTCLLITTTIIKIVKNMEKSRLHAMLLTATELVVGFSLTV